MSPRASMAASAIVLVSALLFGSKGVLIKLSFPYELSPLAILCLRLSVALPCFLAIALWQRIAAGTPLTWADRWACWGLGILGYHLALWFDFEALALLSVGLERMVLFAFPTFVVLIPALWRRKRPDTAVLICLIITYVGIVLAYIGEVSMSTHTAWGIMLVLAAAFAFSLSFLGAGYFTKRLGSWRFTANAMIAASCATLCHGLFVEGPQFLQAPAPVWGYALLLGIGGTVLATLCMNEGMRRLGPQRTAVLSSVSPVCAIVLAWIVLAEQPSVLQACGMAVTIIGATALAVTKHTSGSVTPPAKTT